MVGSPKLTAMKNQLLTDSTFQLQAERKETNRKLHKKRNSGAFPDIVIRQYRYADNFYKFFHFFCNKERSKKEDLVWSELPEYPQQ
jgi:hypothetical protein